jgi:hypothetical protein
MTLREADTLRVRMFSRRIDLEVPEGIEYVLIEKGWDAAGCVPEIVSCATDRKYYEPGCPAVLKVPPGGPAQRQRIQVTLEHLEAIDPKLAPRPAFAVWPLIRRILAESRDRLSPLFS